ncbi:hypothetical protein, partial [Bradyrhizobium cosmicum]|uniref:hypothetical protein n=1 Tax=Bradyrhizobium cosmicum TaxID=1404864 RepID=UPI0028ED1068
DKVRGEWSLMALCYNFSRVLSILGFDSLMAYLANRHPYWPFWLLNAVTAIATRLQAATPLSEPKYARRSTRPSNPGAVQFLPSLAAKPIGTCRAAK